MIKLSCNSCGAKLELTDDIDRFSCLHCGSEWLVNKGGGVASLKPVEEKLENIIQVNKEIVQELKYSKTEEAIRNELQLRDLIKTEIEEEKRIEKKVEEFNQNKKNSIGCVIIALLFMILYFIQKSYTVEGFSPIESPEFYAIFVLVVIAGILIRKATSKIKTKQ